MPIFDPKTYSPEQAAGLVNIPGQSLADTNTPEQIKAAQSKPGIITPESLGDTEPLPVVGANPVPVYDVLTLTPQEQQQQEEIKKQKDLNNQTIGKSAFQAEQDEIFGVNKAQANINDLSAQLTAIKNEAAAIPLQLQQQAAGKAITNSVLGAQENARLRTNAIAALGVSTLLAASQGQLANAQAMADKAVAQKYEPIEEQIRVSKANLQLIIDDPETSLADKNRALRQQAIQDEKKKKLDEDKENEKEIWDIATSVASNQANFRPSGRYQTAVQALQAIQNSKTKEEALNIALETGLLSEQDTQIIQLADGRDVLVDTRTGNVIKTIGGGSDDAPIIRLSASESQKLLGSGLSSTEIRAIEKDVSQFGIDAVLEGIQDPTQKKAIQETYGVKEKVTRQQVEMEVTQKFAQDKLKETFTPDELIEFAKEGGFGARRFWFDKSDEDKVAEYLNSSEARKKVIDLIYEQYKAAGMVQDFKGVGGDTNQATVDRIANTIAILESQGSGDYKAIGPKTRTGDRAYGKYQIMGANIAQWSKEALGKAVSVAQFIANPQLQDRIAKFKMNQYYARFKDPAKVAAAWFAGPGGVNKLDAKDVTGTSIRQYVTKFKKNFS